MVLRVPQGAWFLLPGMNGRSTASGARVILPLGMGKTISPYAHYVWWQTRSRRPLGVSRSIALFQFHVPVP